LQIYRKAAFKIVDDLGDDALPEPAAVDPAAAETSTVEKAAPPPNEPGAPDASVPKTSGTPAAEGETAVTTAKRPALRVPEGVHVRITPETLKDYVGPPVYHKDRMYARAPPPGVSTGLGYLGNGSGAVMPIEATVRVRMHARVHAADAHRAEHAGQGRPAADGQAGRGNPGERADRALVGQGARVRARHHGHRGRAVPERPRHPRAHARGQHREGGPERGHRAHDRVRLAVHEDAREPGHR
jgi:hypothetical protein